MMFEHGVSDRNRSIAFLIGRFAFIVCDSADFAPQWGRPLLLCVYQKLKDKCQVLDAQCDGTWVVHMNWAYLYFDAPLFCMDIYILVMPIQPNSAAAQAEYGRKQKSLPNTTPRIA